MVAQRVNRLTHVDVRVPVDVVVGSDDVKVGAKTAIAFDRHAIDAILTQLLQVLTRSFLDKTSFTVSDLWPWLATNFVDAGL